MKLLKLTSVQGPVLVNAGQIVKVTPYPSGESSIILTNGDTVDVSESLDDILRVAESMVRLIDSEEA